MEEKKLKNGKVVFGTDLPDTYSFTPEPTSLAPFITRAQPSIIFREISTAGEIVPFLRLRYED